MRVKRWCILLWSLGLLQNINGQSSPPPPFLSKVVTAFGGSSRGPASVALSGSAVWIAGSQHESGTLQLEVAANGTTNENWSFSTMSHSYAQGPLSLQDFNRNCVYTDANSKQHTVMGRNCLQFIPWFFPAFVLEPSYAGSIMVADETSAEDSSKGQKKITYSLSLPSLSGDAQAQSDAGALAQKPITATIYYDALTALPTRLVYHQTLDGDESRSLDVSVEFSDYRPESGFMLPHHIQRYLQRTLQVDLSVTSVTIR